ncbi:hypothetical protein INR21_29860, partial [Klebsiella pneumoniae]|nr:hypothetical protein [Klebsiella pneumoniae]
LEFDTTNFPGFTLMPQTPKTAPGYASVSINGGEYYFIKGNMGPYKNDNAQLPSERALDSMGGSVNMTKAREENVQALKAEN